jgi:hypothetical protein
MDAIISFFSSLESKPLLRLGLIAIPILLLWFLMPAPLGYLGH